MRQFVTALVLCYPLLLWSQSDTTVTVIGESGIFSTDANNPTVDWLTPDGGEALETDEAFNGTWDASDENIGPTPISISFSLAIGDTFFIVVLNEPDNSFVSLAAPSTPTDYLRIKITVRDMFGNESHDYSQGYIAVGSAELTDTTAIDSAQSIGFTVDSQDPWIDLFTPDGGDIFSAGQSITSTWNATDNSFGATPIAFGLTAFIGDTIQALADNLPNTASTDFNLPTIDTRFARIHIFAKDDFGNISGDISNGYITIGNPPGAGLDSSAVFSDQSSAIIIDANDPFVDLFTPNGGETYLEETNFNVSWDVSDELLDTNPIAIFMSTAIGGFFDLQVDSLADDAQEVITAPLGPVEYGQIRLTAKDHFGNLGQDQSDGYFSVFESGTGAIQGYLHVSGSISGTLYLSLWFPGHDPDIDGPDREQLPFPVNNNTGDSLLYSFANLLPGSGYAVRAFIDQAGSDNSGNDFCDYGYDLSGFSTLITVSSDLVSENTDIDLVECENYNNGDFSLNFDGIDDYLEIPDASGLNPDTAFTICTWVFPPAWNENGHVISKGIANNQYSLKADTNYFEFEFNGGSGSIQMSLPPFGVWTFISAVFKNNRLELYGNGILQSATDVTGPLNTSPDPLIIGRRSPGSPETDSFNGLIDYISIWNRGLTSAEITTVMENGVDPAMADNLSGYWNFVEGVVNTIHDESFAGNHGTIHGALWDNNIHFIEPDLPPQAPQNITVVAGDHSAYLSWQPNLEYDLSLYSVFRDTTVNHPQLITQVNHPEAEFYDIGIENGRTYYYWLSAVDLTGNVSDTVGAVSVVPNGAPNWTGLADTSFYEDDSLEIIIAPYVFDDSDPDSTLNIIVTSGGNIFNDYDPLNYRLVLWAEPDSSGFNEQVYLSATDPFGLTAQDSFNVSVIPVNDPPVISSPAVINAVEGYRFVYQAIGSDPDDSILEWTFTDLPSWIDFDADSLFGVPYENAPDTSFSIHLSDGELTDSRVVVVMVEHVDNRPVITSPLTASAVEDEYFIYQANGFDPEEADLTWEFHGLVPWLNAAADSVFGTPLEGASNTSFQMIASDGSLEDTATVQVLVEPVNDRPVITSSPTAVAVEDQFFYYLCQANDPEDSTITWIYPDLPAWLTADADSIYGVAENSDTNTTFSIVADDGELLDTLQVVLTIQYVNDPPVIDLTLDESEKHDQFDFTVSIWDEEQDTLTVEITYSLDNISWLEPDITTSDNLTYTWSTATDLGDQYQPQVWLKIECRDSANTTIEISQPFAVDNHVGTLELNLITAGLEFFDQIEIPFQINDSTADTYALETKFSTDAGLSWQTATVSGTISAIRPSDYSSSLVWESRSDLPDDYLEVQLEVVPTDGWQVGRGDTLLLLIDNQALSLLTDYTPGLSEEIDWHSSFQLEFSLPMDSQTLADGIQVTGDYQGIIPVSFTYDPTDNTVMVIPDNWYYAADSVRVTANSNLKDVTGDPFDANGNGLADGPGDIISIPFGVGLLADYDHSGSVEFDDLVIFRDNWLDDSTLLFNEIGPAAGIPPLMQIQPDSSFDFEDLMVFVQMWNWSAGFENNRALLAKSSIGSADLMDVIVSYPERTSPSSPEFIILTITLDSTVVMGALETIINYDPAAVVFDEVDFHLGKNWIKLTYAGQDATIIINTADLQRNPDDQTLRPFSLRFRKKSDLQTSIELQADIRNRDGNVISVLRRNYQFATTPPLPQNYALHQNYPNPFNPLTNIKYELPNDGQVKMTIYNLLGQEVRVLVDSWQPAGYHSVQWNGLNNSYHAVSGGVYLLRIETKSFNAVRKLILLK